MPDAPERSLAQGRAGGALPRSVLDLSTVASGTTSGQALADTTSLARRYFGLHLQDLSQELAETLGLTTGDGVLIADIDPRSVADEAGFKRGLVIHRVGRYAVTSTRQIEDLLEQVSSGSVVDFTIGVVRRVRGQNVRQLQSVPLTVR